mmetsp:Transcript_20913/g.38169  ORF Transcript_20913/g.38169 Transcript_20913/m.38169 type:complete len:374 (-) Transcript_20913:58-1179(-)
MAFGKLVSGLRRSVGKHKDVKCEPNQENAGAVFSDLHLPGQTLAMESSPRVLQTSGPVWVQPPSGDILASVDLWTPCSQEVQDSSEVLFEVWRAQGGRLGSQDERATFTVSDGAEHSVDFATMTSHVKGANGRSYVLPLVRLEGGVQTHPPRGQPHPLYIKQASARDPISDWLNNDFFFRAFIHVMGDSGHVVKALAHEIFDFRWNQDFRSKGAVETLIRGGVDYREPVGWKKFAVRVMGQYEGGNTWLRLDGAPGEWAVAYHGTQVSLMPRILTAGLQAGERQAYKDFKDQRTGERIGCGIYCTPDIATAAEFSPLVEFEGRKLQFVFQCRVRPEAIKRIHEEVGRESGAYWLINSADDIRPYGVMVREVKR